MKRIALLATLAFSTAAFADHYVQGHYRSDGTYVDGHMQSDPNEVRSDNLNSQTRQANPYTGERGHQRDENSNPPQSNQRHQKQNNSWPKF